jgi:ribose transport system permease protein
VNMESLIQLRYRIWPDHILGEVLSKRWTETAIPVALLGITFLTFYLIMPSLLTSSSLFSMSRQGGEIGLIVLGLSLVMIVGGIDLSVGSIFALTNFVALLLMNVYGWPTAAVIGTTLVAGALLGAINGVLIGLLRLRAFLTTLITLIVYRAAYDIAIQRYSTDISAVFIESESWDWFGGGELLGLPTAATVCLIVAVFGHIFLTRLRPGWHVLAIGGSRRSAYNSGIAVNKTVALCYVGSGLLTSMAAISFASRLSTVGGDIGVGLEVTALTAAVVGGIRLGGGSGSVTRALVGTMIVLIVTNGLINSSVPGGINRMVLSVILVTAAVVEVRWLKNRNKIINKVYVSPTYFRLPESDNPEQNTQSPYAVNNKLKDVEIIGLDQIEGPEDVILDKDDNLYCGSRHGEIIRFLAPDYTKREVFARIGGQTLGLAFDKDETLYVCVGGMGLYSVAKDGIVSLVTDETNRSLTSVIDDSRLRLADDLDIAPDGRIFFSEATTRYEMHEWSTDSLEARGNGRIICYDPSTKTTRTVLRGLHFANGILMVGDGQSLLFAETWGCRISRYWFDGPKKGTCELIINLPGLPDNINRASDGNFWVAMTGMRSPAFDLSMRVPRFRHRMASQLPPDEWLFPNINVGCVIKINLKGEVLDCLWDQYSKNHATITSMREHKGRLFIGGLMNNRIGIYTLPGARRNFVQHVDYWKDTL